MNYISNSEIFLLEEIVRKNFSSKYKDSTLGVLWTILNPLLTMTLFTILFSTLFHRSIENYPLYFLCGRCIFSFFTGTVSTSLRVLKWNQNILKRTPAPKYIFILGSIISEFLNFIITLILLFFVMIATHAPFYWSTMFLAIIPVISISIMVTGLGFMLSIAGVYYTDIQHLWSVFSMMLMYASALFFPMSLVPQPYRQYLLLNPIYWVIDQFRCFVYLGTIPQLLNMVNSLLLSAIILVLGIIVFKKYENNIAMKF